MADNKAIKSDATATILTAGTKEVAFSGDTIDIQLVELVAVGGTEGARTITEISSETDGLLVNLGTNNDVTVASGTIVLGAGTAEFGKLAAGTAVIGHVIVDSGAITVDMGANNDVTVTNPTAANLKAEVIGTGTFVVQSTLDAETTKVIGTVNIAAAQSVTANLGTIADVSTETTLSTLNGKVTACNTGAVVISSGTTVVTSATAVNLKAEVIGTGTFVTQSTLDAETTKVIGTVNIAAAQTIAATQSGTFTVQPGNTANTTPWLTAPATRTTGGVTTYHLVSAATTNATNVKASAGQIYGWYIYNSNAAARKIAFHNTAGTPTAGASIFFSLVIPATSGANAFLPQGIAFSTGIGISTVTGLADSDTAAVALNDLIIDLWYA